MTELDPQEFARGINDAIRALRAVYGGVRTMLAELADELRQPPTPWYDLGVRVKPATTRINPDERFLRTWEGRFYSSAEPDDEADEEDEERIDDEDADDERSSKRDVPLSAGQSLAFVKVVLYHREADEGEPHLLCGVLRDARVRAGSESLMTPRSGFRRILDIVGQDIKPGLLATRASIRKPPNVPKSRRNDFRLTFRVDEPPTRYRLFDLSSREKVREIAFEMKRIVSQAPGKPSLP